jgi:hypothetical protein
LNFIPREFVDLFIKSMQFKFATDRIDWNVFFCCKRKIQL